MHFFYQVSDTVKCLQEIYGGGDEEASKLFKLAVDSMNVYNQEIKTMKTTRVLFQDNMNEEQFEMWDSQYIARRPLQLKSFG